MTRLIFLILLAAACKNPANKTRSMAGTAEANINWNDDDQIEDMAEEEALDEMDASNEDDIQESISVAPLKKESKFPPPTCITSYMANAPINRNCPKGLNVRKVVYDGGEFENVEPMKWVQRSVLGEIEYAERNRDEWSAYLTKDGESGIVKLDLWTLMVVFKNQNKSILQAND